MDSIKRQVQNDPIKPSCILWRHLKFWFLNRTTGMFLLSGAEGRGLMAAGTPGRCSRNRTEQMCGLHMVEKKKRFARVGVFTREGR